MPKALSSTARTGVAALVGGLRACELPALKELFLCDNPLSDAGCAALASGVSGHPRLLALELLFHGCTVSVDMKQRVGRLCQEISSRRRPDEGRDSPDVQRMMRQRTL